MPASPDEPAVPVARARGSFAARLFGYDLFISFALGTPPRGTQGLASDLARRLRERDLTVFFSEDEAPPGSPLDATLRRALHRSRVLVVLVNHETLRSPRWVRLEVEEFRHRHPGRPVIPVNIGGALQDEELASQAQAWLPFQGHIWVDADAAAANAGRADDGLVERLATAPRRVRANVAWRRVVGGSMTLLAALTTAFGLTAWVAVGQRNEAVAVQVIAQGATRADGDLDTRLLAGAEALRRYPQRLDARLQALAQRARAADLRALLRPGFDPGGWAVSRDGRQLVLAGAAGDLALLSLADWHTLDTSAPEAGPALRNFPRLVLGPDGTALLTERDGTWTWRAVTDGRLQPETRLRPPAEIADAIPRLLSPDNRRVIATSPFAVWAWTIGDPTATRLADGAFSCLAFSADGSEVRIGDANGMARVRLADAREAQRRYTATGPVYAGSVDCARVLVAEATPDGHHRVSVRDALGGATLSELAEAADTLRPAAAFSRDGRLVAIATSQDLGLWSAETGTRLWAVPLLAPTLGTPFISPGQDWVALKTGNPPLTERRLQVHDARNGSVVLDVAVDHPVDDLVFGQRGDAVLTLGPGSGERRGRALPVWWLGRRDRLHDGDTLVQAQSVEFDATGDALILAPKDGPHERRDPFTGALRGVHDPDRGPLQRAAAARLGPGGFGLTVPAPDGRRVAVGDGRGEVALVDLPAGGPGRVLHRHPSRVTALAFDPRGEWIASAAIDPDGDVLAQPIDAHRPPVIVARGAGRLRQLQFIDSARWLRVDDTVWDVEQRVPVAELAGTPTRLAQLALAPRGDALAWLFADGSLRLGRWSAPALVAEACTLVPRNLDCDEWRRLYGGEPYQRTCPAWPAPRCAAGER